MTYMILQAQGSQALTTAVANEIALTPTLTPLGGPMQLGSTWSQALVTASSSSSTSYALPAATADALGGVKLASYVANTGTSTATDVTAAVTDLNTLATNVNAILSALQTAGIMAASS